MASRRWPPGPVTVVSPHLDDGVMSCGELLASHPGSRVVTVFTGSRPPGVSATEWDRSSGFGDDVDAAAARRAEDTAALAVLEAEPVWLGFVESQYGVATRVEDVSRTLADALAGTDGAVVVPMGLWHDEHRLVHEAALAVLERRAGRHWVAYADALYRRYDGGAHLQARHEALAGRGVRRDELGSVSRRRTTLELKLQAVACYRSQLLALHTPGRPGVLDAFQPEEYWALGVDRPRRQRPPGPGSAG